MKRHILTLLLSTFALCASAQLSFNTYVDVDYVSTLKNETKRSYSYEHSTVNQISLNHAVVGMHYFDTTGKLPVECKIELQTGDYVQANYSSEPSLLQNIYDAYVSIHVHKYISVSGGIFGSSFLGPVSTKAIKNYNPSFSMASDYSPYYMTGVDAIFQKSDKFSLMVGIFNGYQRIHDNNTSVSPGFQATWTPNNIVRFNIGGLVGNEADAGKPQEIKMLFTPDITFSISKKFRILIAGQYGHDSTKQWYNLLISDQIDITNKWKWGCRGEYFNDDENALALYKCGSTIGNISTNIDYWINKHTVIRLEGKYFRSTRNIYPDGSGSKYDAQMLGLFLQFKI